MKTDTTLRVRKCERTACFGNRFGYCDILTQSIEKCPFFKTEQRAANDRAKALERLLEKPGGHVLIDKYYGE